MSKIKRFARQKGLSFYVVIKKPNGKVLSRLSPQKSKVSRFLQANWENYAQIYLKVTYKPGIINEGVYLPKDKHEVMNAWNSFTSEDLIKDALTY